MMALNVSNPILISLVNVDKYFILALFYQLAAATMYNLISLVQNKYEKLCKTY